MKEIEPGMTECGVVLIGRNEGGRLIKSLSSVIHSAKHVVYVDSGSTDGSAAAAKQMGVTVVDLDLSIPFTAARARNAGFAELINKDQTIKYVQFVDGDCELRERWLGIAVGFLENNPRIAIVSGRRRELFPDKTIYNKLCNYDWDLPIGETRYCGGDAMMRVEVFKGVGGFNGNLIAGEEPELCIRIGLAGWKVWRLEEEMSLHDANITKFSQWWRRTMRGGYAYAEGAYLHGDKPARHFLRQSRRILVWGWVLPVLITFACILRPVLIYAFLIYPLQVLRVALRDRSGMPFEDRLVKSLFFMLARFPEAIGQGRFWLNRFTHRSGKLIEYK